MSVHMPGTTGEVADSSPSNLQSLPLVCSFCVQLLFSYALASFLVFIRRSCGAATIAIELVDGSMFVSQLDTMISYCV